MIPSLNTPQVIERNAMPLHSETTPEAVSKQVTAPFSVFAGKGSVSWVDCPVFPGYQPVDFPLSSDFFETPSPTMWFVFDGNLKTPNKVSLLDKGRNGETHCKYLPGEFVASRIDLIRTAEKFLNDAKARSTWHIRLVSIPQHKIDSIWLKPTDATEEDHFFLIDTFKRWGGGTVQFNRVDFIDAVNREQEQKIAMYQRLKAAGHDISSLGG
jgi:hypothetical protein